MDARADPRRDRAEGGRRAHAGQLGELAGVEHLAPRRGHGELAPHVARELQRRCGRGDLVGVRVERSRDEDEARARRLREPRVDDGAALRVRDGLRRDEIARRRLRGEERDERLAPAGAEQRRIGAERIEHGPRRGIGLAREHVREDRREIARRRRPDSRERTPRRRLDDAEARPLRDAEQTRGRGRDRAERTWARLEEHEELAPRDRIDDEREERVLRARADQPNVARRRTARAAADRDGGTNVVVGGPARAAPGVAAARSFARERRPARGPARGFLLEEGRDLLGQVGRGRRRAARFEREHAQHARIAGRRRERRRPFGRRMQDGSEREEVRARVGGRRSDEPLGRCVRRRHARRIGLADPDGGLEVDQHGIADPTPAEEHVLGLQVPVHPTRAVDPIQHRTERVGEQRELTRPQHRPLDPRREGGPAHVLEHETARRRVDEPDHRRPGERAQRLGLARESVGAAAIARRLARDLEHHLAPPAPLPRAVKRVGRRLGDELAGDIPARRLGHFRIAPPMMSFWISVVPS